MQTSGLCRIERNDLPSMLSTLCSYENLFGPYHPHTLRLMAEAGLAFWHYGECTYARPLLERAVRDLGRYLGREHEARLRAITALRDLLLSQGDYERARAAQMELLECQTLGFGPDHPGTTVQKNPQNQFGRDLHQPPGGPWRGLVSRKVRILPLRWDGGPRP